MWYIVMKKFKKIYIEITNKCNLNCSFCSKIEKQKKSMTIDEFEYILGQISAKTDYIYLHVKGEPLLHPNVIDFIKLAEKYNVKVNLTTNGILFPKLVDKLKECKALRKINFSLHCEQNIPDYFNNIFNCVDSLPKNITIIYRLWTLENGKLDKKSTEIVEKIADYYNLSTETVNKLKNDKNIKISSTIYVDKANKFEWPEISSYKSNGYCYALKTHLAILSDGTVVPCCLDSNGKIALGNIFKENIETIMKTTRYINLKKSFQDRKPTESLCISCKYKCEDK